MLRPERDRSTAAGDDESAVFPAEPPPWVPRALAWLLIALFATVLAAAILVRVPETIESRFVLEPQGGADPIQAPRSAVVEDVRVREGQTVKRGQTLFVLRVDQVRDWRAESDSREGALRTARENSRKLDEAHASSLRIKDGEIGQARREVQFRTEHVRIMQDLVQRAEKLAVSGLISDMELTSHRLSLSESQKDLELARKSLARELLERDAMDTERARQRIAERSGMEDLSIRIASLRQPLASSANDLLEIRAPYDGVCLSLPAQSSGRVVSAGDALCQLSPTTRPLQARLDLPESGVPQLAPRQPVRLLFDAFPYQRYGVVPGELEWVSPAAVAGADRAGFIGIASMESAAIRAGGSALPLRAGMQGVARITVGRRSLIEFAIEPLRQLREDLHP